MKGHFLYTSNDSITAAVRDPAIPLFSFAPAVNAMEFSHHKVALSSSVDSPI
jgi:hypothetical protein